MTEVFKTRIEQEQETSTQPSEPRELPSDSLKGNETKAKEELTSEENKIDIWEGLNRRRFGEDYFNIKNIVHEFPLKAEFGFIDKFIKSEMSKMEMSMTVQNYESLLQEIENEIGTTQTETYKRINKIFQYIKVLSKYREIKDKKEAFRNSTSKFTME